MTHNQELLYLHKIFKIITIQFLRLIISTINYREFSIDVNHQYNKPILIVYWGKYIITYLLFLCNAYAKLVIVH